MKSKRIVIIITVLVFVVIFTGVAILAVGDLSKKDFSYEPDSFGYFTNEQKSRNKLHSTLWSGSVELLYSETTNQRNLPVDKRADIYGTYDSYLDSNDNIYFYLYNTDIFCGYIDYDGSAHYLSMEDIKVDQKDALNISNDFLNNKIKPDIQYKYSDIQYHESAGVYIVRYIYYINGFPTDDECVIRIRADNGKIASISMFNYKRYEKYNDTIKISDDELTRQCNKTIKDYNKGDKYEIIENYITLSDSGELLMFNFVNFSNGSSYEEFYIPVK